VQDAVQETLRLLWEHRPPPKRGPMPTLRLDEITRAGIELADRDGLGALTMPRVAEAVGVTKMALYRYVPGKTELVALMVEGAVGAPPHAPPGDWRARLEDWAQRLFERFARHPWALDATVGARPIGPNELGWAEQAVAALDGDALTGSEKLDVTATLAGHVRAIAAQTAGGAAEQELNAAMGQLLAGRADRFPALAAAMSAVTPDTQDQALSFGLARILDGVQLLITERSTRLQ